MTDPLLDCQAEIVGIFDQMQALMSLLKAGQLSSERALQWERWTERALERMDGIKETLEEAAFEEGAARPEEYRREIGAALDGLEGMREAVSGMREAFTNMRPSLIALEQAGAPIPLVTPSQEHGL